jgi:ABC-type antimicrobial peptide transport system permease subunit
MREFGVRMAVGSGPGRLLARVLSEGLLISAVGIAAGTAGGYLLARLAEKVFGVVQLPGALSVIGAAAVLIAAAAAASLMPAARAAHVDVVQVLRAE